MKKISRLAGTLLTVPAAVSAALAQTPPSSTALPEGGRVVAGEATIQQSGASMSIRQSTDRTAIDWQKFDVGSGGHVDFVQPSSSSVALNRVIGSDASQIFGRITANGQVFLSNPNGVYFAPTASVNVGGLVATTHAISLDDFMAGRTKFDRQGSTASVVNEGELKAALGGYVALLAPEVRNQGVILANLGTVALAAGETFELQFGANNTLASLRVEPSTIRSLVDNRSAVLAPGGLIILSAQAVDRVQGGVVRNSGQIEATTLSARDGRIV
ncbi:MAG: filamentous hemagglutinin N-terminal domain-containing protein, partial [Steroidobacteraceae bacterium]